MLYKEYFPLVEYYKKVVIPINPQKYRVKSDKMMVCPLHGDINPSMGVILNGSGDEIFHCFGCNQWGSVVDLHKKVKRRLFHQNLSDEEVLKDLCRVFNVPFDKVQESESSAEVDSDVRRELAIREAMGKFDISDFKRMITEGKMRKKSIVYFNTITMMMVNEIKKKEVSSG